MTYLNYALWLRAGRDGDAICYVLAFSFGFFLAFAFRNSFTCAKTWLTSSSCERVHRRLLLKNGLW